MKNLYRLALIFVLLSIHVSVSAQCVATWSFKRDSASIYKIWFSPTNNNASTYYYKWSFGDGTYSDNPTPVHIYNSTGKFRICLYILKKDSSCSNLVCDSITVGQAAPPPCLGTWTSTTDSVNKLKKYFFANNTSSDFYYKWSFGDGTFSDNRTPNHTYSQQGKFKVCLTVTKKDSTCSITICDSIQAGTPPATCLSTWTAKPDSANKLKWYFNANNTSSDYYYKWYFGDGTTSDLRTPNHVYQTPGKYKICLSVIRKDSACANYTCDSIVVGNNGATCIATWYTKPDSANKLKWYFAASNTSADFYYKWYFGDGTTSDSRTPTKTYQTGGKYKICLSVIKKDSTCANYFCDSINVNPPANTGCQAGYSFYTDSLNKLKVYFNGYPDGSGYTYKWSFGDGTYSDNRTPVHTYAQSGKYRVCLKVTKKDSTCTSEKCDSITFGGSSGCEANFKFVVTGKQVAFTNTSGGSYNRVLWNFGDNTQSDMINPTHVYSANGTYTVCLGIFRIENKDTLCKSKKCITVVIANQNSNCVASFSRVINNNDRKITFTNTSTGSNLLSFWTFGDDSFSTTTNPTHTYSKNGVYRICLYVVNQNDTSCKSVYCVKDTVAKKDTMANQFKVISHFNYSNSNPFERTMSFFNQSEGPSLNYLWDFGDGETSDAMHPVHTFNEDRWYLVCLQVTNNSSEDNFCQNVYPSMVTGTIEIKKKNSEIVLSPNPFDSHININNTLENINEIKVYNINGQCVYTIQPSSKNNIEVNTTGWEKGIYFISITTDNQVITRKLIK